MDVPAAPDPDDSTHNPHLRREERLPVSVPAVLRCALLAEPRAVEIVDVATAGARLRGIELPVGTRVTVDFTPPDRDRPVSARGVVVHGTHQANQPWIGVVFRLVAMRGGR